MTDSNIIAQGAEAILIKQGKNLVKSRIKKSYRLKILDEKLRKSRTKSEAKILNKVSDIISVPKVIETDNKEKIKMQFIEGKKLSEHLDSLKPEQAIEICKQIGQQVAKIHDLDIVHGDLTTSNMILVENFENNKTKTPKLNKTINKTKNAIKQSARNVKSFTNNYNFKVYIIDFGLGFHSKRIEDKAVDLHLLRQALEAKHFQNWEKLFNAALNGYNSKDKTKILGQLKKVEARGRYKH